MTSPPGGRGKRCPAPSPFDKATPPGSASAFRRTAASPASACPRLKKRTAPPRIRSAETLPDLRPTANKGLGPASPRARGQSHATACAARSGTGPDACPAETVRAWEKRRRPRKRKRGPSRTGKVRPARRPGQASERTAPGRKAGRENPAQAIVHVRTKPSGPEPERVEPSRKRCASGETDPHKGRQDEACPRLTSLPPASRAKRKRGLRTDPFSYQKLVMRRLFL